MEGINDYLKKRAQELGLERADQLSMIQQHLDKQYPNQCRAVSLNKGALLISTSNASVASELRFSQQQLKAAFPEIARITIHIA